MSKKDEKTDFSIEPEILDALEEHWTKEYYEHVRKLKNPQLRGEKE